MGMYTKLKTNITIKKEAPRYIKEWLLYICNNGEDKGEKAPGIGKIK